MERHYHPRPVWPWLQLHAAWVILGRHRWVSSGARRRVNEDGSLEPLVNPKGGEAREDLEDSYILLTYYPDPSNQNEGYRVIKVEMCQTSTSGGESGTGPAIVRIGQGGARQDTTSA